MKEAILKVKSNKALTASVYEMRLSGDVAALLPGQFVELRVEGTYLRRPFGVADVNGNVLTILYRVQGVGTDIMSGWKAGREVNALIGLGNGFSDISGVRPLIIGGGMGIAPLYYLAKSIYESGTRATVVMGFRSNDEAFYVDMFAEIADVVVATDDGSLGTKGNVLDAIVKNRLKFDYYYACGPIVMLKGIKEFSQKGEMSLEARMGCGFGACMGCSIQTTAGNKRVCKEGPVFKASEVIF